MLPPASAATSAWVQILTAQVGTIPATRMRIKLCTSLPSCHLYPALHAVPKTPLKNPSRKKKKKNQQKIQNTKNNPTKNPTKKPSANPSKIVKAPFPSANHSILQRPKARCSLLSTFHLPERFCFHCKSILSAARSKLAVRAGIWSGLADIPCTTSLFVLGFAFPGWFSSQNLWVCPARPY